MRHGLHDDNLFEALHAGMTAYLPRTAPNRKLGVASREEALAS
jgi:hypothetical protein